MKSLLVLPLVMSLLSNPQPVQVPEEVVYVGDSRFVGMQTYTGAPNVIAKVGEGYSWLASDALYSIVRIENSHTIVCNLGVNDLCNVNNYIELYKSLENQGYRVIVVSVNPTDNRYSHLNDDIDVFNQQIKDSGLEYVDTCSHLREVGFSTTDGLHYMEDTYLDIWSEINNYILSKEEIDSEKVYDFDNIDSDGYVGGVCFEADSIE